MARGCPGTPRAALAGTPWLHLTFAVLTVLSLCLAATQNVGLQPPGSCEAVSGTGGHGQRSRESWRCAVSVLHIVLATLSICVPLLHQWFWSIDLQAVNSDVCWCEGSGGVVYPVGRTLPDIPCAPSLGGCQRWGLSREHHFS